MAYTTVNKPSDHFKVKTYTGNGSTNAITGVGFKPDWTICKRRSGSASNGGAFDSVRGVTKLISTSLNDGQETRADSLTTFGSDGFTLGSDSGNYVNTNSETFVSWNWLAGGTSPTKTYTVKVVDSGGNKYRFDDFGTNAVTLDLQEGGTYTFDSSDSSVSSHPFVIGTSANSSEYSTGVTYQLDGVSKTYSQYTSGFAAASSRKLIITVAASAPALYYWCSNHSGMGGAINTNTTHGSSNFAGSLQATVSANTTAGYSIVKYTGVTGAQTFGHELGAVPKIVLCKNLDSTSSSAEHWRVYHNGIGAGKYFRLNDNSSEITDTGPFSDTTPTSTLVYVGGDDGTTKNGETQIAYCFTNVAGYSKFDSYTGNDGDNFIYTGFRPGFLVCKRIDSSDNWKVLDTARGATDPEGNPKNYTLSWDSSAAEGAPEGGIDVYFNSNGFFFDGMTNDAYNHSGGTYIYLAIAEQPLVGTNDIPATGR